HALAVINASTSYQPGEGLQFLHSLQDTPSSELSINPGGDQVTGGWLDLALVIRQNLVHADSVQQNIEAWQSRYPGHFMTAENALDLWLLYRQEFTSPQKVAVLLPRQGPLQAAAEAIRDGIMSAYMESPGGAELMFLDTGEAGELIDSAYLKAKDKGVDWIIGPLQKPEIEALLKLAGLAIPVLALNDLPANFTAPPGLAGRIQAISLSQDEEARAVAREAILSGFHNAMVLAPETEWGERMTQDFTDEFLQENRQIVASATYLESENDHSPALEHLLEIDESKARKLQVENALQMKVEFAPVRRDDVDVLFLVASSSQGRSIRPQLRFLDAGDIPAYATGRIFTGKADPAGDQDLNGIRFPITPLQLHLDSTGPAPDFVSLRAGAFTSLYALGLDAWTMLPWLDMMKRDPDFRFPGAAGIYRSGSAGELYREPAFALFIRGVPVPLNPTTASADTGDNDRPVPGD
ncbi:MAG: penicillin-binding protein activator, partial [Xanthomonadales bacterium]|nr:penicillin-binding protein activator [Xanthomonadales bacterium]